MVAHGRGVDHHGQTGGGQIPVTPDYRNGGDFDEHIVVVEIDPDTGRVVPETHGGTTWVVACASLRLLRQHRRGHGTVLRLDGHSLRNRVPRKIGLLWRPNRRDEIVVRAPESATADVGVVMR